MTDTMQTATDTAGTTTDTVSTVTDAVGTATDAVWTATDAVWTETDAAGTTTDAVGTATDAVWTATDAAGTTTDAVGTATDAVWTATDAAGIMMIKSHYCLCCGSQPSTVREMVLSVETMEKDNEAKRRKLNSSSIGEKSQKYLKQLKGQMSNLSPLSLKVNIEIPQAT